MRDGDLVDRIESGGSGVRNGDGPDGPPRGEPPDRLPVARTSDIRKEKRKGQVEAICNENSVAERIFSIKS